MSDPRRVLFALALCRRSGALKMGFDEVLRAARGQADLVVVAADASPRTSRAVERACADRVPLVKLTITKEEIEKGVGKAFAVAAVCGKNQAALVSGSLQDKEANNAD